VKAFNYFVTSFVFAIITVGCDKHSAQTLNSDRRVVAVAYSDPHHQVVKYLLNTNDDDGLVDGVITKDYALNISVTVVSSNSISWGLKFLFDETNYVGDHLQDTQEIELPYPQMRQVKFRDFNPLTVKFLSDQEILTNSMVK
jgi:hypothetical protein